MNGLDYTKWSVRTQSEEETLLLLNHLKRDTGMHKIAKNTLQHFTFALNLHNKDIAGPSKK